jgi:hypothetical protein
LPQFWTTHGIAKQLPGTRYGIANRGRLNRREKVVAS